MTHEGWYVIKSGGFLNKNIVILVQVPFYAG